MPRGQSSYWDYAVFGFVFFLCFAFLALLKGCWLLIHYQKEADNRVKRARMKDQAAGLAKLAKQHQA